MLSNQIDHQLCKSDYNTRLAELQLPSLHYRHQCGDMHRRWKVEKVWGAEHCRLRGLSLSRGVWGHASRKILKKTARRLNLGHLRPKNSIILTILSNE